MREIKFRAWDKIGQKMCDGGFYLYPNGKLIWRNDAEPTEDSYILMQYTGLCDKNGREIYEGDIVKQEFTVVGDLTDGQAGFSGEDIGIARILPSKGVCIIFNNNKKYNNKKYKNIRHYRSEIIGNIFENKELLQEKKD